MSRTRGLRGGAAARALALPEGVARRYEPLALLGEGAYGRVLLCRDRELDRRVAVKLLSGAAPDALARERFEREARVTARVRHSHCVVLLDHGSAGDAPYLVYEYVPGASLREALRGGRLFRGSAGARLGAALAGALAAAHREGVLHRDVKPENVVLRGPEDPVLCDFGLSLDARGRTRLTASQAVVGTPVYLAPELWAGGRATAASDEFALAVTLFEARYGVRAFRAQDVIDAVGAGRDPPAPPFPEEELDRHERGVQEVLRRSLSMEPEARFGDLTLMEARLRALPLPDAERTGSLSLSLDADGTTLRVPASRIMGARPPPPRSRIPALGTLLVLLVALAVGWSLEGGGEVPTRRPATTRGSAAREARERLEGSFRALFREHLGLAELVPPSVSWEHIQAVLDRYVDPRFPLRWSRFLDDLAEWIEVVEDEEGPGALREGEPAADLEFMGFEWAVHVLRDMRRLVHFGPELLATEALVRGREDIRVLHQGIEARGEEVHGRTEAFVARLASPGLERISTPRLILLGWASAPLPGVLAGEVLGELERRVAAEPSATRRWHMDVLQVEVLRYVEDLGEVPCALRGRAVESLARRRTPGEGLRDADRLKLSRDLLVESLRWLWLCPEAAPAAARVAGRVQRTLMASLEGTTDPEVLEAAEDAREDALEFVERHLHEPTPELARILEGTRRLGLRVREGREAMVRGR